MSKSYRVFSAIIVSVILFISCADQEPVTSEKQLFSICLALKKDVEILPFPKTRSIPEYKPSEPHSAVEPTSTSLFTRIEYVVYHKESGAIVKSQSLTEDNSEDFGAYVYDELEVGTYHIVLLAHASSGITVSGNQAEFSEMTDSFYAQKEITVGPETEDTHVEIILKRIVARVEFVGTKSTPDQATKFIMEIEEQYNTTNLKENSTIGFRALKKAYPLSGGIQPEDAPNYSFYTFVPEPLQGDTTFLSGVKLITLNADEDTLHTIHLHAIPVMRNRITRYTGSLYAPNSNSNTLALEVEDYGHWKDTIDVPF